MRDAPGDGASHGNEERTGGLRPKAEPDNF